MRRMSFSKTTAQFRAKTKTVTRRKGWKNLKAGEHFIAVEKAMGLMKGQKQVVLGECICLSNQPERLGLMVEFPSYGKTECVKEGFPDRTPAEFVEFFVKGIGGTPDSIVQRIEFAYVVEIELLETVRSELPVYVNPRPAIAPKGRYTVIQNHRNSALCVTCPDGQILGVKPNEFKFLETVK